MLSQNKKIISTIVLVTVFASQFVFVSALLMKPKQAEAFWGFGDLTFNTEIASPYEVAKDIATAAVIRIAQNYANQYLTRFINKVIDKYKIKNYLYYDQVLTNYLLTNYIREKVDDPDLRGIYSLLNAAFVTGENTGMTGVNGNRLDPNGAVIPRIRQAIDRFYEARVGDPQATLYGNVNSYTNEQYFAGAYVYTANPPSFTDATIRAGYVGMRNTSTTASKLEIALGNGNKSGRILSGSCKLPAPEEDVNMPTNIPNNQTNCQAAGGEWVPSVLNQIRGAIDNPGAFINSFIDSSIKSLFNNNYKSDNIWAAVGTMLGNFIFNKLNLNNNTGSVLPEYYGDSYTSDSGALPRFRDVDVDGDGFPDGQDSNSDGQLEICYHGGTAPNCVNSSAAGSSAYFTPLCQSIESAVTEFETFDQFINEHRGHIDSGGGGFVNEADADIWSRRTQEASSALSNVISSLNNYHTPIFDAPEVALGRYSHYFSKMVESMIKDKDLDLTTLSFGNGAGGIDNLIRNTRDVLDYLRNIDQVKGRCDDPDAGAIAAVPAPELIDPGDGDDGSDAPCGHLLTPGASVKQGVVTQAMRAVLDGFDGLPADDGNIGAYRDAVVAWLNDNGEVAAAGHNGNCNSSANNLAIRISPGSTNGEMYDIVRTGLRCDNSAFGTIPEHVDPCRLPPDGFTGPWRYVGQGIR